MMPMTTRQAIQAHPNYDADDYRYLAAKGWTDQQILACWAAEAAHGNGPCRWAAGPARAKLAAVLAAMPAKARAMQSSRPGSQGR